ncbi:MAG: hypothetical protein ABW133_12770, partial [Polyangiaceae bacterium]
MLLAFAAITPSCGGDAIPNAPDAGTSNDAGSGTPDGDASIADSAAEQAPPFDTTPPDDVKDGTFSDVQCISCDPPGGQYCGSIGEGCSRRTLRCDLPCRQAGFTCGGGGIANVCGASRDSGVCAVTDC